MCRGRSSHMIANNDIFQPLCKATEHLFRDVSIWPNDRIQLSISKSDPNKFKALAYADRGDKQKACASKQASRDFFLRIQERKEIGYGEWLFAATDFNVLLISSIWPLSQIEFIDDKVKTMYEYLLLRFTQQTFNAINVAEYNEKGIIPNNLEGWVDHHEYPLTDYQKVAAFSACRSEGFAFFMEQGTGKTPSSIGVLMHEAKKKYLETGKMYRCIIVCPKNVKTNWQSEIHKFSTIPGKVVVLRGTKLNRIKQLVDVASEEKNCYFSVAISSYEAVHRTWEGIQLFQWDLGIADESDMFKSPTTKRAKAMLELRDKCKKRLALTGTPVNNSILDIYTQLEWLGYGMSGFLSWKNFRDFYNQYAENSGNYQGNKILIGFQNLPILHERLTRCSFDISKKKAMPELPEKTYDVLEVTMSKKQKEVYVSLSKTLQAEIESSLDKPTSITVNHVLTKLLRLNQITSGYMVSDKEYNDEGELLNPNDSRIHWFNEIPKLDELVDLLKSKSTDEKTIVWTCWVPTIHKISERLNNENIKNVTYFGGTSDKNREKAQNDFNLDKSIRVFIGNPAAGGVGMNLPGYDSLNPHNHTTNADHTIYYACNWSYRQRAQSEDRNHGKGRCRGHVRYTDLITPSTIDMEILKRLKAKHETALEVRDVKQIMVQLSKFNLMDVED